MEDDVRFLNTTNNEILHNICIRTCIQVDLINKRDIKWLNVHTVYLKIDYIYTYVTVTGTTGIIPSF